ncbi:MAG: DUF6314 family protein [Inquilinaceae bacterium]
MRADDAPILEPSPPAANGGAWPVADLRAYLIGSWTVERRILDRRPRRRGSFTGRAVFAEDGDGLRYRETGRLRIGDHDAPAEQIHRYEFPAPSAAAVFFRDGRPFHRLDLTTGRARAVHPCHPDLYRARFKVLRPDAWCVLWRVTGPSKRLRLATLYSRQTAAG